MPSPSCSFIKWQKSHMPHILIFSLKLHSTLPVESDISRRGADPQLVCVRAAELPAAVIELPSVLPAVIRILYAPHVLLCASYMNISPARQPKKG
jgi:hypothetical protein